MLTQDVSRLILSHLFVGFKCESIKTERMEFNSLAAIAGGLRQLVSLSGLILLEARTGVGGWWDDSRAVG